MLFSDKKYQYYYGDVYEVFSGFYAYDEFKDELTEYSI